MDIRQIRVSIKRLVAGPNKLLGKFENISFECTAEATLAKTDNAHEAYDQLARFCKNKINDELDRLEGIVPNTPVEEDYIPGDGFKHQGGK